MFFFICFSSLISVIFTWFLLSSYLLKLLVFLYFFWFDFYLYLLIHLCFEGMSRFQINLQGLYMQSGARPIESSQLTSSQAWIQEKTNPIKFKSNWSKESKEICNNPSPIRIRISACTSVSIFSITLGSNVQLRWFKLGWKVNLKGYNFVVYQKPKFWS